MSSGFASVRDFDDFENSSTVDTRRSFYVMIGVLFVSLIVLVALLASGGYVMYIALSSDDSSGNSSDNNNSPSNTPTPIVPLNTTNVAQLCSSRPSGSELNTRGEAIYPIPALVVDHMINNGTWKEGCPVPIEDLTLLNLPYWSCEEGTMKIGEMIVHLNISNQVLTIFDQLFISGYPIYQMKLMSAFGANDSLAMANNNTSSFCCREKTNKPGTYSLHSYGLALDVNTFINPYVNGATILPEGGVAYANRSIIGTIIGEGGVCYDAFNAQGFTWGGNWESYKDYQHFEVQPQ